MYIHKQPIVLVTLNIRPDEEDVGRDGIGGGSEEEDDDIKFEKCIHKT